jgi:hypothetical protein
MREGAGPKSQEKRENRVLLEMLISKVEEISVFVVPLPLGESSVFPFIGSSGGRGVLRRCLRGESAVGAVEVAMATCPSKGGHSRGVAVMSVMGR